MTVARDHGMPFARVSARSGWQRRGSELARRSEELVKRANDLLDGAAPITVDRVRPGTATEFISTLTWVCIERLRDPSLGSERAGAISVLVCDLQQLALELFENEMVSRTRRIEACEAGLAHLRGMSPTTDLIDRIPKEIVRSCGFDRALLSRVEDGKWTPWVQHFAHPDGMEQWLQDWMDTSIPLDEMTMETQLLTERRPALIHDTDAEMIHPIIREALSRSYVVAPVMPAGNVVGFLHVDHGASGRQCDETDREVLWAFAEGFGHIYERAVLLERLRSQRQEVQSVLASVSSTMSALNDAELELAAQPDQHSAITRTAVSVLTTMTTKFDELTPRELEVLELIVSGARNQTIAEQLVITQGTVKSHVKHILRKLGAVNRSQVIAQYVGVFGDTDD